MRITVLPEADRQRLEEIVTHGSLECDQDLARQVHFLASVLLVVVENQSDLLAALQEVADRAGVGR